MSPDPKPRPLNHLWNTAQVVGVIVTLTGFTPERWMTAFLDAVKLPDWLLAGIDVRFIAVGVGVAIIAVDAFLRHRRGSQQPFEAVAAAPVAAASPFPAESLVAAAPPPTETIEPIKDKPSIAVQPFVKHPRAEQRWTRIWSARSIERTGAMHRFAGAGRAARREPGTVGRLHGAIAIPRSLS
ncbi:MAG: hypothetical protein AB7I68_11710 [Porticoccaceae bacterium]